MKKKILFNGSIITFLFVLLISTNSYNQNGDSCATEIIYCKNGVDYATWCLSAGSGSSCTNCGVASCNCDDGVNQE